MNPNLTLVGTEHASRDTDGAGDATAATKPCACPKLRNSESDGARRQPQNFS